MSRMTVIRCYNYRGKKNCMTRVNQNVWGVRGQNKWSSSEEESKETTEKEENSWRVVISQGSVLETYKGEGKDGSPSSRH